MSSGLPRPAYVVDYDESTHQTVRGTRRTAREKKEKDNKPTVSRRKADQTKRRPAEDDYSVQRQGRSSEDKAAQIAEREVRSERRKSSSSSSTQSPRKSVRPPSAHKNKGFSRPAETFTPSRRDEPEHFGVRPNIQPSRATPAPPVLSQSMQTMPQPIITTRPQAMTAQTSSYTRPLSYHSGQTANAYRCPPLSISAWSHYTPPLATPTHSMQSPISYIPSPQHQVTAPPGSDYFGSQASSVPDRPMSTRPLSSRFDIPTRTSSGFGMRDPNPQDYSLSYDTVYHDDGYTSASDGMARKRESIRVPSKATSRLSREYQAQPREYTQAEADFQAMPPPPRPSILRAPRPPPSTDYPPEPAVDLYRESRAEGRSLIRDDSRPRRTSSHRNSVTYDLPPEERPRDRDGSRSRRPSTHRNSASYDFSDAMGRMSIEPANQGRPRPTSYYGPSAATSGHTASTHSSGLEDKLRSAANYQEDVGGPSVPLTAEVLRRQQRRNGGSSRSTKSSASRDESDYRKSATTRTTRSGSGADDENVTIKITGGRAHVNVGGAQIDCPEGGEIEIKRQTGGLRGGSEPPVSEYGTPYRGQAQIDDRQSRVDRPTGRSRMSSNHSYTRTAKYFGENYI